jgi:hypothetical protein
MSLYFINLSLVLVSEHLLAGLKSKTNHAENLGSMRKGNSCTPSVPISGLLLFRHDSHFLVAAGEVSTPNSPVCTFKIVDWKSARNNKE